MGTSTSEFDAAPALVFLDRGRLRAAGAVGHLDDDTVRWAEAAMDSCGLPDGLPVMTLGVDIAEPLSEQCSPATQSSPASCRRPGPRLHINFSPKL